MVTFCPEGSIRTNLEVTQLHLSVTADMGMYMLIGNTLNCILSHTSACFDVYVVYVCVMIT